MKIPLDLLSLKSLMRLSETAISQNIILARTPSQRKSQLLVTQFQLSAKSNAVFHLITTNYTP